MIQWVNKSCTKKGQRFFWQWISWFWTGVGGKKTFQNKIRLFWRKCIFQERFKQVFFVNRIYLYIILKILLKLPLEKPQVSECKCLGQEYRTCHRDLNSLIQLCGRNWFLFFEIVLTVTVTVQFYCIPFPVYVYTPVYPRIRIYPRFPEFWDWLTPKLKIDQYSQKNLKIRPILVKNHENGPKTSLCWPGGCSGNSGQPFETLLKFKISELQKLTGLIDPDIPGKGYVK